MDNLTFSQMLKCRGYATFTKFLMLFPYRNVVPNGTFRNKVFV